MASVVRTKKLVVPAQIIQEKIYVVRGAKVMLGHDLASLYEVETKALMQAVRRNRERFPDDFMFQLTGVELNSLRSQFVTLEKGRGRYPKYLPYAFTEQGVAMLSAVLRSNRAIQVSIGIIRVFVSLRQMIASDRQLAHRIDELEKKYDGQFHAVFQAIRRMVGTSHNPRRRIGFRSA